MTHFFAALKALYPRHLILNTVLKHYMNPLHLYCRLRDLGISRRPATLLCKLYERNIFNRWSNRGLNRQFKETHNEFISGR